jgi:hypothetical protein
MNPDIQAIAVDALAPLVGAAMARVYVNSASQARGRMVESLGPDDVDWLCDAIRQSVAPFVGRALLDDTIADIRTRCGL